MPAKRESLKVRLYAWTTWLKQMPALRRKGGRPDGLDHHRRHIVKRLNESARPVMPAMHTAHRDGLTNEQSGSAS